MSGKLVVRAPSTTQQPFPVYSSIQFSNVASIESTGNDVSVLGVQVAQEITLPEVSCSFLNGNGSQLSFDAPFAVNNVLIADETWSVVQMPSVASDSDVYYIIQGVGFLPGTQVFVDNVPASSVEYINSATLYVSGPPLSDGTYDLRVVLPDTRQKVRVNGISYDPVPVWSTPSDLGAVYGNFSIQLQATETNNSQLTFTSDTLPLGMSLTLQGTLEGTNNTNQTSVKTFTVTVRDEEQQIASRQFLLTYSPPPIWQDKSVYNVWSGELYLQLAASEANGSLISYSNADPLPGNLVFVDGMIRGNIEEANSASYDLDLISTDLENQIAIKTFTLNYNAYTFPTLGLIGQYTGDSYVAGQWQDVSGGNLHATIGGTVTTETLNGYPILTGTTATNIVWPTDILPSTFTLVHYTRYKPTGTKRRIFAGDTTNWLNGFQSGGGGKAHHNGWIGTSATTCPDDWVLSTSTGTTYRANKSLIGTTGAGNPNYDRLTINSGVYGETSDWMCAEVLVYNRILTDDEVQQAEDYIFHKYVPLVEPTFALSARSLNYANNTTLTEWQTVGQQIRVATAYAVGGASLPTYDAAGEYVQLYGGTNTFGSYFNLGATTWNLLSNNGFTFVGYVRFSSVENLERVFDFGNGAAVDNIWFGRRNSENVLRVELQDPTLTYDRSGIVNNVWQSFACRLKQESTNVWRWSTWIDGRWEQSGTFSNSGVTNRTLSNSYIGRSNWSNDEYSALALRELWFYDRALSDQEVWRAICKVEEGYSPV